MPQSSLRAVACGDFKRDSGSASRQPHSLTPSLPPHPTDADGRRTCNLQCRKEKMRERPLLNLRKLCATGAGGVVKGSSAERGRLAREHNYFSDEFNSKTAEIKPPLPDFVAKKLPSLAGHHPVTLYEKQIVGNYACEPQIKCSLFPPASSRSPARPQRPDEGTCIKRLARVRPSAPPRAISGNLTNRGAAS